MAEIGLCQVVPARYTVPNHSHICVCLILPSTTSPQVLRYVHANSPGSEPDSVLFTHVHAGVVSFQQRRMQPLRP